MKKEFIISFFLLLSVVAIGCIQKPLDKPDVIQKDDSITEKTDQEVDSLFEEELNNLPEDKDLTALEDELV